MKALIAILILIPSLAWAQPAAAPPPDATERIANAFGQCVAMNEKLKDEATKKIAELTAEIEKLKGAKPNAK